MAAVHACKPIYIRCSRPVAWHDLGEHRHDGFCFALRCGIGQLEELYVKKPHPTWGRKKPQLLFV